MKHATAGLVPSAENFEGVLIEPRTCKKQNKASRPAQAMGRRESLASLALREFSRDRSRFSGDCR
jgi:hypothetical protein